MPRKRKVSQIRVYPKATRRYHVKIDKQIRAKPVGRRKSASGRVYSERRENRSDVSRKRRL